MVQKDKNTECTAHLIVPIYSRHLAFDLSKTGRNTNREVQEQCFSAELVECKDDYLFDGGIYAPANVREIFPRVLVLRPHDFPFATESIMLEELAANYLAAEFSNFWIEAWGHGVGLLVWKFGFKGSVENLINARDSVRELRDKILSGPKIERCQRLHRILAEAEQWLVSEGSEGNNPWLSFLSNDIVAGSSFSLSIEISGEVYENLASDDKEEIISRSTGLKDCRLASYGSANILAVAGGNNGQIAAVSSVASRDLVLSHWKVLIVFFSSVKVASSAISRYATNFFKQKRSQKELGVEIRNLRKSITFFQILSNEGTGESIVDTELERAIYTPVWIAWGGDAFCENLRRNIDRARTLLLDSYEDLRHYNNRVVGALLFFIAIIGTSQLSPLIFRILLENGLVQNSDKLFFEVVYLAVILLLAAVVYFWPRRV
ncbi:hypothetical protein [Roseovarius salis]|uniref:hypothetical protein n=1 Tax=Roseovarius salis TaxID=3376063 RepID=UPI0037C70116